MLTGIKSKAIVVTGANGMVGSHLITFLLQNSFSNITIALRGEKSLDTLKQTLRYYNIEDRFRELKVKIGDLDDIGFLEDLFAGKDIVYNTAARVAMDSHNSQKLIRDNVHITHCMGRVAKKCGVCIFVHVSSIATFTADRYPEKTTEESIMRSIVSKSPYSISKFYCETDLWRIFNGGLNLIVVNPAVILGSGRWSGSGSPAIFNIIAKGMPFYSEGVTGYVDVEDVAKAMVLLSAEKSAIGQRFLLCGKNMSYERLFKNIAAEIGAKSPYIKLSSTTLRILIKAIRCAEKLGVKGKLSTEIVDNLISKYHYDGSKIERFFAFEYTPIEQTIRRISQHYNKKFGER